MRKKTILYGILIFCVIISGTILALAENQNDASQIASEGGAVFFYTGSPLALSDGEIKMLDTANPDIGATVIGSRTLLPLRAVSEYFGAEVSYDQTKKEAVIKHNGKQFSFPIGSASYTVGTGSDRKKFSMDSKSLIIDGRTMVPLRVICENVLGKTVTYYDRVIAVADHEVDLKANKGLVSEVRGKIGEAVKAGTVKELEAVLKTAAQWVNIEAEGASDLSKSAAPAAAPESAAGVAGAAQNDTADQAYSTTNVQVEGIDEADVVKTDGKYLYVAGGNVVRIIGADDGKLSDDTVLRLSTDKNVSEIYLDQGRLVVLGTRTEFKTPVDDPIRKTFQDSAESASNEADTSLRIMPPHKPAKTFSFADVYDISDQLKPVLVKSHEMEGYYQSSRKNGDIVYLVTNMHPSDGVILPMMRDTTISNKEFSMKLNDVMIMTKHPCPGYVIISALNVNNQEKTEVEAITAYGSNMYMNESSLYLAFESRASETSIIRFDLKGMKVGYAGSGSVPGYLLNQFSMDEYENHLRVATTDWNKGSNSLYVLDQSLNITGSVENLAKGESIYSVRFMGNKGYVVTFRTIDPLFVFDLSDPKKPVLTGELKVPGFSSYLHPVGKDILLGIGADTYEIYRKDSSGREIVEGVRQGGIKFSLFDVSDMGKPKELSNYVIGDSGSSEAFYNHKAVMIDPAGENAAIDAYVSGGNLKTGSGQGAIIMNYSNNKLTMKGFLDSKPSGVYGNDIPFARRILYIGDELYYIQDGRITSYDYDSLKEIDSLVLQ